jgi:hypothetical protein
MRKSFSLKYPGKYTDEDIATINNTVQEMIKEEKGVRIFIRTVQSGLNGDDFVNHVNTLVVTYDAYKKPRFIK